MGQWLRVFAAVPQEPCLVPSTYMWLTATPALGDPTPSSGLREPPHSCTYTQTHRHTNKMKNKQLTIFTQTSYTFIMPFFSMCSHDGLLEPPAGAGDRHLNVVVLGNSCREMSGFVLDTKACCGNLGVLLDYINFKVMPL